MNQTYTSANTSINSSRVPALYKKIDFPAIEFYLRERGRVSHKFSVLDYGCGKFGLNAVHYLAGIDPEYRWRGYDPYNLPDFLNRSSLFYAYHVCLCSSVLNVIDSEEEIQHIAHMLCKRSFCKFYFISVYEGDRSGVGRKTKEDCYQRNEKVQAYLRFFPGAVIKHGVITNAPEFVK